MKKQMTGCLTILFLLCVAAVPVLAEQSVRTESILHVSDLNSPDVKIGVPIAGSTDIAVREQLPLG